MPPYLVTLDSHLRYKRKKSQSYVLPTGHLYSLTAFQEQAVELNEFNVLHPEVL